MQMLVGFQDDPIIKHYEQDIVSVGTNLYIWTNQIETELEDKLIKDSSNKNSCEEISSVLENIQRNFNLIQKSQLESQRRFSESEVLIDNFLSDIKSDDNLGSFIELNMELKPYENLQKVIETIRNYFLLESPGLIAQFADVFANIHKSLQKTVEIYESFIIDNKDEEGVLIEIYNKNC